MEIWGQTQKVHEKEMSDEDARRVGQWTIGLAGGPRALPTLHGLQVFLGDHDWTDSSEADSFRRSVLTVSIMVDIVLQCLTFHS